jgi:hypothetical protein
MVAPLLPQAVQRARCRSTSLDVSRPHRMTATTHASGAWCWQRSQFSHSHGVVQIAERGGGAERLHGRYSTPAGRVESSRYLLWWMLKATPMPRGARTSNFLAILATSGGRPPRR